MKSLNLLKKRLLASDLSVNNNLDTAMYLLPDGSMIDGNFAYGCRNEDHRAIFAAVNYGDLYESPNPGRTHWDRLHKEYKVVRLVPESNIALIKQRQRLTAEQLYILKNSPYEIEKY